jgi:hypothetical protein
VPDATKCLQAGAAKCLPNSVRMSNSGSAASRVRFATPIHTDKLRDAGFQHIEIDYNVADAREFLTAEGVDVDAIMPQVDGNS